MTTYIVRRLLIGSVTLMLIMCTIYGLIRAMPGDPALMQISDSDPSKKLNPEDLERNRKSMGLDKPWYVGYVVWLGNLSRLEMGTSYSQKQSVISAIREKMAPTLLLSINSILITYVVSIPLGLYSTARKDRLDERAASLLLYMLYSFPTFVAALLLQMAFAVRLGWLPLLGMNDGNYEEFTTWGKAVDLARHAILPIICETYVSLAYYSRFVRSTMSETMRQDFIRTARAKGCSESRILLHHAFRNTLIPLVTLIGLTLPALLSGSVIIEQIFTWPGLGRMFFEAITARDYPLIMGLTLFFSLLTLAGTLLADILYAVVDPRISYS